MHTDVSTFVAEEPIREEERLVSYLEMEILVPVSSRIFFTVLPSRPMIRPQ